MTYSTAGHIGNFTFRPVEGEGRTTLMTIK